MVANMGIEFTKESLDLVLDKRDEMIELAEKLNVPIHESYNSFITCVLSLDELKEISKMLEIEKIEKQEWSCVDEYEYEMNFVYRGHKFYYLKPRKAGVKC